MNLSLFYSVIFIVLFSGKSFSEEVNVSKAQKTLDSFHFVLAQKDSQALEMTWTEAKKYCESQNMIFPQTKDFIPMVQTYGAVVIEVAQDYVPTADISLRPSQSYQGFYLVASLDQQSGQVSKVLYNHSEFRVDEAKLYGLNLWTASLVPQNPNFAHVLYGNWGGGGDTPNSPQDHMITYKNHVACLKK